MCSLVVGAEGLEPPVELTRAFTVLPDAISGHAPMSNICCLYSKKDIQWSVWPHLLQRPVNELWYSVTSSYSSPCSSLWQFGHIRLYLSISLIFCTAYGIRTHDGSSPCPKCNYYHLAVSSHLVGKPGNAPGTPPWKGDVILLHYIPKFEAVARLKLAISSVRGMRLNQFVYTAIKMSKWSGLCPHCQ